MSVRFSISSDGSVIDVTAGDDISKYGIGKISMSGSFYGNGKGVSSGDLRSIADKCDEIRKIASS